jgi:CBS domain containing-hemolysin-like protein
MHAQPEGRRLARRAGALIAVAALVAPAVAQASFLSGETLDTAANVLAWFVLIVMPFAAIGAFLYVHVLPEVIAEKRQHPHKDSIKVLCILSLFFGGLLWPFAWLWAYTRPVAYRAIYGTEKHHDYYVEMGEKFREGKLSEGEIEHLNAELAAMTDRGVLPPELRKLAAEVAERVATIVAPPSSPSREHSREVAAADGGSH